MIPPAAVWPVHAPAAAAGAWIDGTTYSLLDASDVSALLPRRLALHGNSDVPDVSGLVGSASDVCHSFAATTDSTDSEPHVSFGSALSHTGIVRPAPPPLPQPQAAPQAAGVWRPIAAAAVDQPAYTLSRTYTHNGALAALVFAVFAYCSGPSTGFPPPTINSYCTAASTTVCVGLAACDSPSQSRVHQ